MSDNILKLILARDPGEKEYHQAVKEFLETVQPVLERNPEYRQLGVLERITEPERTITFRQPVIRDTEDDARQAAAQISAHNAIEPPFLDMAGTADMLVEQLLPYLDLGYRHLIFQFLAPFDRETMDRLISEVKPQLESA